VLTADYFACFIFLTPMMSPRLGDKNRRSHDAEDACLIYCYVLVFAAFCRLHCADDDDDNRHHESDSAANH
jgi:hypothetical protein